LAVAPLLQPWTRQNVECVRKNIAARVGC